MDVLEFRDATEWDTWLTAHGADAPEAWLRIGKRRSGLELISIEDALEVVLCHGWIDGLRRSLDEASFLQRYSPRTKRSPWSRINATMAERLIAEARMKPAGLAAIEAARADGRWPDGEAPRP